MVCKNRGIDCFLGVHLGFCLLLLCSHLIATMQSVVTGP